MELQRNVCFLGEGDQLLHAELSEKRRLPLPPDLLGQPCRARRGLAADLEAVEQDDVGQSQLGQVISKTRPERARADDNRFRRTEHPRFPSLTGSLLSTYSRPSRLAPHTCA